MSELKNSPWIKAGVLTAPPAKAGSLTNLDSWRNQTQSESVFNPTFSTISGAGSNPAESNHCGYGETGRRNGVIILDNKVTLWPTSVLALKYGRASSKLATHTNLPKVTRNEYKTVVYSGPNLPSPQPSCGSD